MKRIEEEELLAWGKSWLEEAALKVEKENNRKMIAHSRDGGSGKEWKDSEGLCRDVSERL